MKNRGYIKKYIKRGSSIIIKRSGKEKDRILNTPENEKKVLELMKEDTIDELRSDKYIYSNKNIVHNSIITTLWSLIVIIASYIIIRNSIDQSTTNYNMPVYILDVAMFVINSAVLETKKYLSCFKEKYRSFFDREDILNEGLKKYPSLIENVNKKAKEEIENNMADGMENPINVNSIRLVKLKELRSMIDKLEFYQDLDIETAQDVIDDYNGNLEELSKKYDSVEVEKPKMKKHLIRRL